MKKSLIAILTAGLLLLTAVPVFAAAQTPYTCPSGNTACVQNGACLNDGTCINNGACTGTGTGLQMGRGQGRGCSGGRCGGR